MFWSKTGGEFGQRRRSAGAAEGTELLQALFVQLPAAADARVALLEGLEGLGRGGDGVIDVLLAGRSESLGLGPSDSLSVGLAISAPSAPAEPCLAGGGAPSPLGGGAG